MTQTGKVYGDSKRIGEILGYVETARLFARDVLQAIRFVFEKGMVSAYEAARQELKFMVKRFTVLDYVMGNLSLLGLMLCFAIFLSGFGLLGYQTVGWLQDGVWNALPMMLVFEYLFEGTALGLWMQNPESWIGLQQLLEWTLSNVPISLVLMAEGLLMAGVLAGGMALAVLIRRFQFKHQQDELDKKV